jgi:hypothetical protein
MRSNNGCRRTTGGILSILWALRLDSDHLLGRLTSGLNLDGIVAEDYALKDVNNDEGVRAFWRRGSTELALADKI